MRDRRRTCASRCRAVLAWGLLCYLAFQVALIIVTDNLLPELRDPEYGHKLSRLRQRLAGEPGRALIFILGSSPAGYGFRPEAVPDLPTPNGPPPTASHF